MKYQKALLNILLVLAFLLPAVFDLLEPGEVGFAQSQGLQEQEQVYLPIVDRPKKPDWPMAGANPQRTSFSLEEVSGRLKPVWYRPIEPYIPDKAQIIAAYGNLYISTARGLYVLDAATGAEKWIYPTEMPLGHSPTVHQQVVYVGGFDHKIHALHALTGRLLWTFEAGAGFDTNPLVVQGMVFAGNRDGYFYAIRADGINSGEIAWRYKTGGPIHFSAAYQDGVVYFASDDSRAYALDATTGRLVWKSEILPGSGFHSWWPVIYRDWVIFPGSNNYRLGIDNNNPQTFPTRELKDVFPNYLEDPRGTLVGPAGEEPGDWASGTPTLDLSRSTVTNNGSTTPVTEYFEDDGRVDLSRHDNKPWRRTYIVLNRANGKELTFDSDGDGNPEYAPILWFGTDGAGNRYPPVVGLDGVIYQPSTFMSDSSIAGGGIVGWKIGTPFISLVSAGWNAIDEPMAITVGGGLIYISKTCDRGGNAIDYTIPADISRRTLNQRPRSNIQRGWTYFEYNLPDQVPGYNVMYYPQDPYNNQPRSAFGGRNGSYTCPGDENPPIPYQGRLYFQRSNAIISFGNTNQEPASLPLLKTVWVQNQDPAMSDQELRSRLAEEVTKIISAGHLKPGYLSSGLLDMNGRATCGADLADYFNNPAETLITLLRALPYLAEDLQQETRTYLQSEFSRFPPYKYTHIGWRDGAVREAFFLPPEIQAEQAGYAPETQIFNFEGWKFNPLAFYAMWKYAREFGNASTLFNLGKEKLETPPEDGYLVEMPHVLNAYIAGYWGYLELEDMATNTRNPQVQSQLNRMLALRKDRFSADLPDSYFTRNRQYCRGYSAARNFMYLVPELGFFLGENATDKVQEAVDRIQASQPYWFASKTEAAFGEGVIGHLYDPEAVFQARALILGQPRRELVKYLDVPAFQVGDLFYIQKLVSAIEAGD